MPSATAAGFFILTGVEKGSPTQDSDTTKSLGLSQSLPDEMFHGGRLGGLRAVLRFELAPDGVDPPPELLG